MASFIYTVWFRDTDAEPSDQDYEWNACLCIQAESAADAQAWGDFLAKRRAEQAADRFMNSTVAAGSSTAETPVVRDGQDVTDAYCGW